MTFAVAAWCSPFSELLHRVGKRFPQCRTRHSRLGLDVHNESLQFLYLQVQLAQVIVRHINNGFIHKRVHMNILRRHQCNLIQRYDRFLIVGKKFLEFRD